MRYAWLLVLAACGSSEPAGNDGGDLDSGGAETSNDAAPVDASGGGDVTQTQDSGGGALPLSIPGVSVWLRADHVTTDQTGVAVWPDLTTNHNDFAPSGTHPPVLATIANGQPAVDMTTVNTFTGHASTVGTGPLLVEIVVNSIQKGTSVLTATSAGNSLNLGTSSNGSARAWEATTSPVATASSSVVVTDAQWHILGVQIDASQQISLRHNGTLVGGPSAGANLNLGMLDTTNIGGDAVAEFVVVVGAISSSDQTALESYLKARYKL